MKFPYNPHDNLQLSQISSMTDKKKIRYIELFAWVWGFRLGLKNADEKLFKAVWSNQWEPSTKEQHASNIYVKRFWADGHSNKNISEVPTDKIPDHDMIVGWFPCQDYSIAKSLKYSKWIVWKKWVLWWEIHRIINEKETKPKYLLLENVDRLLKSPVNQRGRDFAIMLASLSDLGYIVEWRVINAADYWMPQRRRRVFLIAYHESTNIYKKIKTCKNPADWVLEDGVIAREFSVLATPLVDESFEITGWLEEITTGFNVSERHEFQNAGIIVGRKIYTAKTTPEYKWERTVLKDILLEDHEVPVEYFIKDEDLPKWKHQKAGKKEKRINKSTWFEYHYSEWWMLFPDALDKPSRTIITWEWWSSASRFKHVVETKDWRKRRLTPIELERLNMFPDNHTEWVSDVRRAFFMWNALVVWIIKKLGEWLSSAL